MKTYLITAAGVIFITVIVSLLVPEGKLNKSTMFVLRMVCILVLIQPITGIFKIPSTSTDAEFFDYAYVCEIYGDNQSNALEKAIFKEFGIECECNVKINYDDGDFKVAAVEVALNYADEEKINEISEYLETAKYINITVYAKSN